ncbi:MAG: (2Fe-2S)-binding protein [Euzebyales bacterium]|nr:(2Fe-2S)-binding protein [Euzebyales bacterium]
MLVCHCTAVNEARLRAVVEDGARDEFDVAEACGAGSVCGGCVPTISRLLDECRGCPLAGVRDRPSLVDAGRARP